MFYTVALVTLFSLTAQMTYGISVKLENHIKKARKIKWIKFSRIKIAKKKKPTWPTCLSPEL